MRRAKISPYNHYLRSFSLLIRQPLAATFSAGEGFYLCVHLVAKLQFIKPFAVTEPYYYNLFDEEISGECSRFVYLVIVLGVYKQRAGDGERLLGVEHRFGKDRGRRMIWRCVNEGYSFG